MLKRLFLVLIVPAFVAACSAQPGYRDDLYAVAVVYEQTVDTFTEAVDLDLLTLDQAEAGYTAAETGAIALETASAYLAQYEASVTAFGGGTAAHLDAFFAALTDLSLNTGRIMAILEAAHAND